jgi:predicted DNA-binding ribbon-helix-helix protein
MKRKITRIEASVTFWKDLEAVRKESWYTQLRRSIAEFVTEVADGCNAREKGFSNPKLKGIMHVKLPKGMRLFHVYPESDLLRLCLVVDHSVYGFNGKHMGREARTADKIWRDFEVPVVHSPFWDDMKWKLPSDILSNPEISEMSNTGLNTLLAEIEDESHNFARLIRALGVKSMDDVSEDQYDLWAESLIEAQDLVIAKIEENVKSNRKTLELSDFHSWLEM